MDRFPDVFQIIALALSAIAALSSFFVLLGFGRKSIADQGVVLAEHAENIAAAVRTEADRTRTDIAEQSRNQREELNNSIRRVEDALLQRLDAGIESIRASTNNFSQKLDADIAKMGQEATENRDKLKASIEVKLDATDQKFTNSARDLREELTKNFASSSEILANTLRNLGQNQIEQLAKVERELTALSDRQAQAQEVLRQAVEGRLDAIRKESSSKLDEMRQTVDEKLQTALEKRLAESFRTVSEQLERVHLGLGEMQTLASGVVDLNRVLTNVKTRGTWAEVQLRLLLEQFLSPEQFAANVRIKENSADHVEFAIRFLNREAETETLLPIDAKFPREDYERLVRAAEAADPAAVEAATAALIGYVRASAKAISEKYIYPPRTTDFAILYLPTEGLFAEVLRQPGLQEQLQLNYHVTIAGPTTLTALLNAFQMGFRSLAIQKRSSEVWKILGAVRAEFDNHGNVVQTLRRQLNAASNTIDKLGTRTNVMKRKLKDVEKLPLEESFPLLELGPLEQQEEIDFEGEAADVGDETTSPGGL